MAFITIPRLIKAAFLLMLAAPLALKGLHVDNYIHLHTDIRFLGATQVLANDAIIYAFMLALFYLSFLSKTPFAASIALKGLAFLAYLLFVIDSIVIVSFNTHLTVGDAASYVSYMPQYITQVSGKKDILILCAAVVTVGLSAWMLVSRYTINRKAHHILAILTIFGLLIAWCFTKNERYTHSWIYKNVVDYNLETRSESRAYSDAFAGRFRYDHKEHKQPNAPQTPNIIILMVESLSSYQSKYFSGLSGWTPNLDRIARQNVAYKAFYANGFSTNDCYISVLTGRVPIRPPATGLSGWGTPFYGFHDPAETLPRILAEKGYTTEFLIAGDLSFADVGGWVRRIGFDYIEGNEHAYYEDWDRYQFDSAPDEALYDRVYDRIKHNGGGKYLIYVSTLSTHHPFISPDSGNHSEAETVMYADRQLGAFHEKLVDTGFFEQGILIILGDHHSMLPLTRGETKTFGPYRAAARVPLIVSYGNKQQAVVTGLHQQADLFNSLKNMTSTTLTYSDWLGDIFNDKPTKYIAHRRGDHRDIISVFTQDRDYLIKLDGDDTRLIKDDSVEEDLKEELVGQVNAARVPASVK